jgi:dihydroorotate dehydrogenase (fumarate)
MPTTLKTSYLGLELRNPLVAASCPLTGTLEGARKLEAAGAGAIVMRSLFEEQIREEVAGLYETLAGHGSGAALEYLRADLPMRLGPENYVADLRAMRKELKIPLIASLNCIAADQWVAFARKLERAGADALEMNVYDIPADPDEDSAAVEARHLELVRAIEAEVRLPVAVKLSPFYTGLAAFVRRLSAMNVEGIVLFNRFLQPDIDIEQLRLKLEARLSRPDELRLPLRWVALLRGQLRCDLALSGGVHDGAAVVKALLAGANAVYICSALYRRPEGSAIGEALAELRDWMERHGFADIGAFRGRMRERVTGDRRGFERAHYVKTLAALE